MIDIILHVTKKMIKAVIHVHSYYEILTNAKSPQYSVDAVCYRTLQGSLFTLQVS